MLVDRSTNVHLPFSQDTKAFVKAHLERNGFNQAAKDEALVEALSKTDSTEFFSASELIQDIKERDLEVMGNYSSFDQSPYSVLHDYTVRSYRSYGIREEEFVRYTFLLFLLPLNSLSLQLLITNCG